MTLHISMGTLLLSEDYKLFQSHAWQVIDSISVRHLDKLTLSKLFTSICKLYQISNYTVYIVCIIAWSEIIIIIVLSIKQLMSTVIKLEVMNMICILLMFIRSVVLTRSHLEVLNTGSCSPII